MTVMNALNISIARLNRFMAGENLGSVASSTLACDIELVERELGYTEFWRPRLACARRMLAGRQAANHIASAACAADRKRRYEQNRRRRAEENRLMAAGMGAGTKKKGGR